MWREYPTFKPEEILAYLRRSRADEPSLTVEEVLEKHQSILKEWQDRNLNAPIPPENTYKEVVSGETISDRIEFQKVLKRIESPTIRAILVVEVSRLSRGDLEDCGRIIKLLRYTNTMVITPHKIYDLQDEFDRDGFERELKHGNYYLEYSKKLMKRGLDYAVQQNGAYVGSIPPYGYTKIRVTVGNKKIPTLAVMEEEAKIVRMIFDWYANENIGCRTIAERLDTMGVKPKLSPRWTNQSIKKILENEHYIGKIRYYAHKIDYEVKDSVVRKKRISIKNYQLFDGMHEPIIDEETFNRIKQKKSKFPKLKKYTQMRNPLSSILYCECGYAMTYAIRRGVPRYECPEQRMCGTASIGAKELTEMLCKILTRNIEDLTYVIDESNDDVITKHEENITLLKKKISEIERKELSLWEKYTEEGMPPAIFNNLREKFNAEKETAEKALENAITTMPKKIDYKNQALSMHNAIQALNDDNMSAEAKNAIVKACVSKVTYYRQKSTRVTENEREQGSTYKRGWKQHPPRITVTLKM